MNDLLDVGRTRGGELYMMVGFFVLIALVIFGIGYQRERDNGSKRTKYFSVVPLLISTWLMWHFFSYAIDPVIKNDTIALGGTSRTAYMAMFPLSLILSILAPVGAFLLDRNSSLNDENY